ncbi:hypothetical protein [Streptosporangium sp. V21-05]|uniref:hypothetical protein n=1 Tax=Streptosporangium sp. V21-05 TaxID=3446115 RepID=UPI003F52BC0F
MTTQHAAPEPVIGGGYLAAPSRPIVGAGPVTHPGPLPGSALPPTARRQAVGYVRLLPATDTADRDQVTARLRAFAARSGLELVNIYTDHHAYRRSAFGELLQALCDPGITAVVIPTPEALSEFDGIYQAMRALIAMETGADVLVMSQTTEATP